MSNNQFPLILAPNNSDLNLCLQFQVAKLFSKIQEMVEEENNLVFVLIGEGFDNWYFDITRIIRYIQSLASRTNYVDEVESLAAARSAALSGSEPSDSIRVSFSL